MLKLQAGSSTKSGSIVEAMSMKLGLPKRFARPAFVVITLSDSFITLMETNIIISLCQVHHYNRYTQDASSRILGDCLLYTGKAWQAWATFLLF